MRYFQRHSFSIIRLVFAWPEFPYLGYKAASSQGTKLNLLWKCALYIPLFYFFCIRLYFFAIKSFEREKSIFIEMDSNLPTLSQAPYYDDRTQSENVNRRKVRIINIHSTQSAVSWNFFIAVKQYVPEIPHFGIHVVSANKRQTALGSKL
jgi:hypothetical protein